MGIQAQGCLLWCLEPLSGGRAASPRRVTLMQRCDMVGEQSLLAGGGLESVFGDQKRKGNGTYPGS